MHIILKTGHYQKKTTNEKTADILNVWLCMRLLTKCTF